MTDQEERKPYQKTFLLGLFLVLLGPCAFGVVLITGLLVTPWYLPGACTLGTALMLFASVKRVGRWRIVCTVLGAAFAVFTWNFVLVEIALPRYSGAIKPGTPLPAFQVQSADGRPYTNETLRSTGKALLVAYRSW